jgi:hypothetical protein
MLYHGVYLELLYDDQQEQHHQMQGFDWNIEEEHKVPESIYIINILDIYHIHMLLSQLKLMLGKIII